MGDPAAAETQGSRDSTKDTSEIGRIYGRGTGTGELNGQRALLACGQKEGKDEERGPLNGSARLTHAARKGGKGGTPQPAVCASRIWLGGGEGHPDHAAGSPSL